MATNGDGYGNDMRTMAWRITNAEKAIHELETWQARMVVEHSELIQAAKRTAEDMALIRVVSSGTLIAVVSGLILFVVTGHH